MILDERGDAHAAGCTWAPGRSPTEVVAEAGAAARGARPLLVDQERLKDQPGWYSDADRPHQGVTEETTTGVHRLYQMAAEGSLRFPAYQRQRLGHQEQVRQPLRLPRVADRRHQARHRRHGSPARSASWLGYGDVGKGCAQAFRGMGATVWVTEIDPICALQAAMEGVRMRRDDGAMRRPSPTSS